MTFSIVARSGDAFGVAVASKFIAAGSVVPARLGVVAATDQSTFTGRECVDWAGGLHDLYFGAPETVLPLEGAPADEVRRHLLILGRHQSDLHDALADWAGEANFEMRLTPDGIDRRVLQALRERVG